IEELERYIKNTSGAITFIALDLMDVTDEAIRQACQDIALAYGLMGVLRSTRFLLHYDRILVPKSLLDRYEVSQQIFKNGKQNQSLRSIGAAITEIGESLLLKARKTQQNIERGAMPCLLLASLTGLYIKQLKRLNYDVFDLRLSQPTNWRAWVLAFNYFFKKF
ncbi:MAG: squalene/phytoene synthase family protein, partial [Pseudomonadota bacterium]|nr:squalene/phytoene synthase family protein [Pseudomonadota bacterium]